MIANGSERRQRLLRATQPAHARLDALIDDVGFLNDQERYGRYLRGTWAARGPAERALDASETTIAYRGSSGRGICEALRQDMVDVGDDRLGDEPMAAWPGSALSIGQTLGMLYVLEGSARGAPILQRRVASIGMTPQFGARHMALQTLALRGWKHFVTLLHQTSLDETEDARCTAAAIATFEAFEQALRAAGDDRR